jgi:hypothetical protein
MRVTVCFSAVLGALLALPVAGAEADIKPLPKPPVVAPAPAGNDHGSVIAPVSKPVVSTPVVPTVVKPAPPEVTTTPVTPAGTRRQAPEPVVSFGGREQPQLAETGGGRATLAPTPAVLAPTPLGMAGPGPRPVFRGTRPPWVLALLALLAFAEAGLLTHLVRSSPSRARRA